MAHRYWKSMLPLLLTAPAAPACAEQNAAKIAITADAPKAAIILKAPAIDPPPSFRSAYRLIFKRFDAANSALASGAFGGWVAMAAVPKQFVDGYMVADLDPGTYVVVGFSRQDYWTLCFQDNSLQFTVRPGEILYLGMFDAQRELRELTVKALQSGRTSTRGVPVDFFDGVAPPAFAPIRVEDIAGAVAMVRQAMPRTTVTPTAVSFSPARFGTGSTLAGQRRCGGFFSTKAR